MSRRAVFHCRAAPSIGSGHAMRCLTLAGTLRRRGWEVGFAVDPETRRSAPALDLLGGAVHDADDAGSMAKIWPDGTDLAVVDRYDRDSLFERALQPWANRVMAIDDLADRPHDADLLLDSAASPTAYDGLVGTGCRQLLGPEFALLRPEFRQLRETRAGRPASAPGPRRPHVVISVGGTDPADVTGTVLDWLETCRTPLRVTAVLGAAAPHADAARARACRSARHKVTVEREVSDMAKLLAGADLAVGAGGNTAWERCCLGVPTLLTLIAENQRHVARRLIEAGAAISLIPDPGHPPQHPPALLAALFGPDRDRLTALSTGASGLCDGSGADRVAVAIAQLFGDLPTGVRLRPVREADETVLLAWQEAPVTRWHFRNPQPPTPEEHRRWFAAKRADPACQMSILEYDGDPVAFVRLDIAGASAEVSILVAPQRHGCGFGAAALGLIRALRPELRLTAEVLPGNTASHALFRGSGYRLEKPGLYVSPPTSPA